jgi:hypothetical protein
MSVVIRVVIFSGERGTGSKLTARVMAPFQAGGRLPASTVGMNGGAAWSNAQELQDSLAANPACAWLNSGLRRLRDDRLAVLHARLVKQVTGRHAASRSSASGVDSP